jgi:hypothetical protein
MKALMIIRDTTISPFDIKSVQRKGGFRRKLCGETNCKLWHPMINTYIKRLPWWKRMIAYHRFNIAYYYHKPYVQVRLTDYWRNIDINCKNNRERDRMANFIHADWDRAMAKFHGDGCNFNQKEDNK